MDVYLLIFHILYIPIIPYVLLLDMAIYRRKYCMILMQQKFLQIPENSAHTALPTNSLRRSLGMFVHVMYSTFDR